VKYNLNAKAFIPTKPITNAVEIKADSSAFVCPAGLTDSQMLKLKDFLDQLTKPAASSNKENHTPQKRSPLKTKKSPK
jgi:hypothetical protein